MDLKKLKEAAKNGTYVYSAADIAELIALVERQEAELAAARALAVAEQVDAREIGMKLMRAATSCGHSIDHEEIVLRREPGKPGGALAQLTDRLAGECCAILAATQPAAPVQAQGVAQELLLNARAEGRAEAVEILTSLCAETGIDEYTGWSSPVGPEDEGSTNWNVEKLRELFKVDDKLHNLFDRAEAMYWQAEGEKDEAERAKNFAANMHNSSRVRDILGKAGEYDLMAQLCAAPADPLDSPLPCDVTVGAGTHRRGTTLRTLVTRMQVLHGMAMARHPLSDAGAWLSATQSVMPDGSERAAANAGGAP